MPELPYVTVANKARVRWSPTAQPISQRMGEIFDADPNEGPGPSHADLTENDEPPC